MSVDGYEIIALICTDMINTEPGKSVILAWN